MFLILQKFHIVVKNTFNNTATDKYRLLLDNWICFLDDLNFA